MKDVLILGGGKVGKSVAELLLICGKGNYRVTLADRDEANLKEAQANITRLRSGLPTGHAVEFAALRIDAADKAAVRAALKGKHYVVCMLPFDLVAGVADIANELGVHYFDVTEDVETSDAVKKIADEGRAKVALVPQCGLAPGYIAIAGYDIARQFGEIHDLTLRVGALPQYPTNALHYNVTWSTAGVVNEYCEPCNVMIDGMPAKLPALEGLENFSFEGIEYEAFYTSGGVGSLIDTLVAEKKTTLESKIAYKTIRYPGHRDLMKFLLQDVGIIFINCIGMKADGGGVRREQVNFKRAIHATSLFGRIWPAIELTTAAGVCAMVDLHRLGVLRQVGFIKQEECALAQFNQTLFGLAYENPAGIEAAVLGRG